MTYNILVNDRKLVVKKLEELVGERATYTRAPRMAFVIAGIAVERDGTVTLESDEGRSWIEALIAAGMIQATGENADSNDTEVVGDAEDGVVAENSKDTDVAENDGEADEPANVEEADHEEDAETSTIEGADAETVESGNEDRIEIEDPAMEERDAFSCYDELIEAEFEEPDEPEEPEAIRASISFPLLSHRPESIVNLVCTIYTRGKLLSKATGGTFYADEDLVDFLTNRRFALKEEVLQVIEQTGGLQGLSFSQDKVFFDGFPATEDPEAIRAWTALSAAINRNAMKQMHVRAKEVDDSNEKFAFRTWLTRLGMNGPELKTERNLLYRNLSGHTAFRTADAEEKWKRKQAAKREEARARKAEAMDADSDQEDFEVDED